MALIVTNETAPAYGGVQRHWIYNGYDIGGTRELHDVLEPRLDPQQRLTYKFELACQGPAMSCMLRPLEVDLEQRQLMAHALEEEFAYNAEQMDQKLGALWPKTEKETGTCSEATRKDRKHSWPKLTEGQDDTTRCCVACGALRLKRRPFNPMSDDDCSMLLYVVFKLPSERNKQGKVSTDKEVLDRLSRKAPVKVRPFVEAIRQCRQLHKQMEVLEKCKSGRYPTTLVVGAADTGRWSSTDNPYGEGGNNQNITERLRKVFIASPGERFFYADLSQAESFCVAHLCGDEQYIEAHKTGDVHTVVCRLLWPELPWSGDLKKDKEWADSNYPEWDKLNTWRTNCKRGQHGNNYVMSPMGLARTAHIPVLAATEISNLYHGRVVRQLRPWHHHIAAEVLEKGELTTPLGRRRQFFGRRYAHGGGLDGGTHRQAVAFQPQSMVADLLNTALWHVWHEMDPSQLKVRLQVHDAILGAVPEGVASRTEKPILRLMELMQMPVRVRDFRGVERVYTIPTDVKIGRNWGKFHAHTANCKLGCDKLNEGGMR